ncbi:nitroreductase family protein [Desulfovibrio sp.]|uniref:nitroreductase family protein n=1 Tax=Desulfovibrio sp. TaxID=885 RepID=UPI0025C2047B|nr:nitroreductase family protein [Desulfovibrio sp.]
METLKAIAARTSTRNFDPQKPITKQNLETIIASGCAAPVGGGDYSSLHLTAITDSSVLSSFANTAQDVMKQNSSPLYNATALVVISASSEQKYPNIELANAGCIAENMLLAATDLGIGSVFILGAIAMTSTNDALWKKLGVPDGFHPVVAVALGYGKESNTKEKELSVSMSINYV